MAYSIVQHTTNNGTGTSVSVSCAATTAGNLLVAMIGITRNSPLGPDSFTTLPSGWVQIGATIDDLSWSEVTGGLFYLPNCSAGLTSFTWTIGTAPNQWDIMLLEISGVATVSPLDVSNVSNAKVVHTSDTVSTTTTANGDLILGLGIWDDLDVNPTAFNDGVGYTLIQSFADSPGWETLRAVYQTQTSAGAISYAPSWTGNADDILWIVAFKTAVTTSSFMTQAEAKFSVRAKLQTQARAKFLVRLKLATTARSTFLVRLALEAIARATFLIRAKLVSSSQAKFSVRAMLQIQARSRFLIRLKLATTARAKFTSRLALKTLARSKFLINQAISPLKQLKASFASKSKDNVVFVSQSNYSIKFSEAIAMITPNSTIQTSATITDASGNLQAAMTGTVVVSFPDGTTSGPLTPTNAGAGVYTLTYTTKGAGVIKELWSLVDGSGNRLTDENTLGCVYSH